MTGGVRWLVVVSGGVKWWLVVAGINIHLTDIPE